MLIDERAVSQSEHTGLFFEAANGMTFIGTPTMGANGDITSLTLPGGSSSLLADTMSAMPTAASFNGWAWCLTSKSGRR